VDNQQLAFALNDGAFWLSIFFGILGLIVIGGVIWLGNRVYTATLWDSIKVKEHRFLEILLRNSPKNSANEFKALVDSYADHRDKRNEFWSIYGQTVLAIFILITLTILMITKTISAEAGLPILSAVSGFAIAKGASSNKGTSNNITPDDNDRKN
jgi:hypothetical protein